MFNEKYMKDFEHSPAAHAVRLNACERAIEVLTDATSKLGQTANDIKTILALAQQTQKEHTDLLKAQGLDINTLKTDKAFMLGSWKMICVIAAIVVFLAPISNAFVTWSIQKYVNSNRANNGSYRQESQQP